jgi:hypothetical protein
MPVLLPLCKYTLWHVSLNEHGKLKCTELGCHPMAKQCSMKTGQVLQKLKLEIQVQDVVVIGLYLSFPGRKVDYKGRKLYHLDIRQ